MHQHLNMVMLPVSDLARSRTFYMRGLGWVPRGGTQSRYSVKFVANGMLVTMIDREYLSAESGLAVATIGAPGVVLVTFVGSADEVNQAAIEVTDAGGSVTSAPRMRDGGMYTFYFTDPDGNPWEVVFAPKAT